MGSTWGRDKTKGVDAIGDEIVIGAIYGYSQRSKGHHTVHVGRASKINITTNKVALQLVPHEVNYNWHSDKTNVLCSSLLRLDGDWEKEK